VQIADDMLRVKQSWQWVGMGRSWVNKYGWMGHVGHRSVNWRLRWVMGHKMWPVSLWCKSRL